LNCQWANNFIAFSRAAVEAVEGTKTEKNYQFNFVTQLPCAGLIPSPPPATHLLTPFNKKITPTHPYHWSAHLVELFSFLYSPHTHTHTHFLYNSFFFSARFFRLAHC